MQFNQRTLEGEPEFDSVGSVGVTTMTRHLYARKPGIVEWRVATENCLHRAPLVRAGEWWTTPILAGPRELVLFRLAEGPWYKFRTRNAYFQNEEVFSYPPAASVEPPARDYDSRAPLEFESKILGETRKIRVYLPRGYRQHAERRYPVLYVKDGQNIFEHGAFGTWAAHQKLDRLTRRGEIEELIVVAVDHGVGRNKEYVPPEDGGHADRYARFLVEELKPWIDERYRTLVDAANTGIMGSSLGGLVAFYVAWTYPEVFGKVASLSGSWWIRRWRNRLLCDRKRSLRCYLDSGDSGPANDCVQHTVTMRKILMNLGFRMGEDLQHRIARGQVHTESAWGERIVHALRFLFPAADREVELAA